MSKQKTHLLPSQPTTALSNFLINHMSEGCFILVLTMVLFMWLSLFTYSASDPGWFTRHEHHTAIANAGGIVGSYLADTLFLGLGSLAYLLPLGLAIAAWMVLKDQRLWQSASRAIILLRGIGLVLFLLGGAGLLSLTATPDAVHASSGPGGKIGFGIVSILTPVLNPQGASLFLFAITLAGFTWLTGLSWLRLTELLGYFVFVLSRRCIVCCQFSWRILCLALDWLKKQQFFAQAPSILRDTAPLLVEEEPPFRRTTAPKIMPNPKEAPKEPIKEPVARAKPREAPIKTNVMVSGRLPDLQLLEKGQPGKPLAGYSHQQLEQLSRDVEQYLLDFGIQADVVAVHPGPVITRFELQLAAGVKVSKLTALAKDLARSLSVSSVRVVEIIPGKTVVGIELPNQNRAIVTLSEVLSADVYQHALSPLTLALGVDIAGYPMVVDLAKMPHLLVAGTTGSGKSVGINAMILSLLFKSTPEQVRLIMIDPKMLELSVYEGIPHLLAPVVTDMKEAASALRWCVGEMDRRYRLMASVGVRNLAGFNNKVVEAAALGTPLLDPLWKPGQDMELCAPELQTLPYVVVIIDELADMMMVVGKKVEQLIARIAQKARAAGIHLILATQRPSVDVLTGLIKSNIPTRISFQVSSKIDSRTILDQQGAEQLLGHGDMLFLAPGTGAPLRVHGAFVDDAEVHRVADDWRARGTPNYIAEITQIGEGNEGGFGDEDSASVEEADPLYDQAVAFVTQARKASISSVQRRFKIGYNRAARLVEEMERNGIVGPMEGGFRDVFAASHGGE